MGWGDAWSSWAEKSSSEAQIGPLSCGCNEASIITIRYNRSAPIPPAFTKGVRQGGVVCACMCSLHDAAWPHTAGKVELERKKMSDTRTDQRSESTPAYCPALRFAVVLRNRGAAPTAARRCPRMHEHENDKTEMECGERDASAPGPGALHRAT